MLVSLFLNLKINPTVLNSSVDIALSRIFQSDTRHKQ